MSVEERFVKVLDVAQNLLLFQRAVLLDGLLAILFTPVSVLHHLSSDGIHFVFCQWLFTRRFLLLRSFSNWLELFPGVVFNFIFPVERNSLTSGRYKPESLRLVEATLVIGIIEMLLVLWWS